jgi:hypothetical protein
MNEFNETPNTNNQQPEQTPVTDDRDAQIANLESQVAELRAMLDGQRLETAIAKAKNPHDVRIDSGATEAKRQRAIAACGGVSKWYALPISDRVKVVNDGDFTPATEEELGQFFGPKSSAAEAQRLARTDPRRYKALRALWLEKRK